MVEKYNVYNTQQKEIYEEDDVLLLDPIKDEVRLVVYNDDHNTFDWVIESFIKICRHSTEQAEQLSYIIHFNGKATVKTGTKRLIKPMKEALVDRGLSAVMEE